LKINLYKLYPLSEPLTLLPSAGFNYRKLLVCILLLTYTIAFTQSKQNSFFKNSSIGVSGYYGSFLTTQPKSEYIRDSYSYFGEIYFEKQTKGDADWQVSHNYPYWGISYIHGNTGSKKYIGNMDAVYGFLSIPLIKAQQFTTSFRLGAGLGWVQKPYNVYTNPKNTVIGTRLNAYISLLLQNEIKITSRVFLDASIGMTHLSNGGTSLPNLGLNTPLVAAGIRYALNEPVAEKKSSSKFFQKKISYTISVSAAVKQIQWIGGPYNIIFVVQPEIMKRFAPNHAYGGGISFFLNPYSGKDFKLFRTDIESTNAIQVGIFGAYEHFFGRLSIPLQSGAYVYNRGKSPCMFQQFGLRYRLNTHLNTELQLKTHMGKADFIHAGIGYSL